MQKPYAKKMQYLAKVRIGKSELRYKHRPKLPKHLQKRIDAERELRHIRMEEKRHPERVAMLREVWRVDGQKFEGAITFPATVSLTVTNELGYLKQDETTVISPRYNWVQTRSQKVVTLELPVETIRWDFFYCEEPFGDGTYMSRQEDPLITSVTIPEGVKYVVGLGGECLANVTEMSFPSTVRSIVESCFCYCDKLESVSVPEDAFIDGSFIGTPWAQSMGDFFIWNGNLVRYQGTASEVVVPEGVVTLGTFAFSEAACAADITSVKRPMPCRCPCTSLPRRGSTTSARCTTSVKPRVSLTWKWMPTGGRRKHIEDGHIEQFATECRIAAPFFAEFLRMV